MVLQPSWSWLLQWSWPHCCGLAVIAVIAALQSHGHHGLAVIMASWSHGHHGCHGLTVLWSLQPHSLMVVVALQSCGCCSLMVLQSLWSHSHHGLVVVVALQSHSHRSLIVVMVVAASWSCSYCSHHCHCRLGWCGHCCCGSHGPIVVVLWLSCLWLLWWLGLMVITVIVVAVIVALLSWPCSYYSYHGCGCHSGHGLSRTPSLFVFSI
jgi:hypothetical protein